MVEMEIIKKISEKKGHPSLYDAFDLGDRVKRLYKDSYGNNKEYKGIVLAIDKKGMEIYWDTEDGKYKPGEMNIDFTHLELEEIFKGSNKYSPIKKVYQ
jgi:hypothetical protein